MKRIVALILALVMVLGLMAGCGSNQATSAPAEETASAVSEEAAAPEAAPETEPEAAPETEEASVVEEAVPEFTGAVIDAETCQANGYDVEHGMYDWETYVELPLTEEPVTMSYWFMIQPFMLSYNNVTEKDFTYFKEMEARTGIALELTAVSMFASAEQFALMVTSGDYTDMVEGALANYSGGGGKAIEDGFLVDMLDYIDIMPNMEAWLNSDPAFMSDVLTLDGQLACAPGITSIERNVGIQMRGDWLDALGMELPETYDEYHDVLVKFKEEYGAGLWLDGAGTHRNNVLSAGYDVHVGQNATRPFRVVDGVVEFDPGTEDYRDFMTLMNQWNSEGLIFGDFLTQQTGQSPDTNLVLNNQIAMWATDSGTMTTYDSLSDEIDIRAGISPRKEAGQTLHLYDQNGRIGDGTSITTTCKDPELAALWLDYNYTYEGALLTGYGVEGEGLTFDAEGNPMYTELVLNNPDMITVACSVMYSKYGGAGIIDATRFSPGYSQKQNDAIALWLDNMDTDHEYPGAIQMTTEENETYSELMSDLETYVNQCTLQFISGEMDPQADWDEYMASLESLGMEEVTELCQMAYDRYLENGKSN